MHHQSLLHPQPWIDSLMITYGMVWRLVNRENDTTAREVAFRASVRRTP